MSTTIEIILLDEVKGLGKIGQRKQVRLGYARNFLFPNQLALMCTEANLARIESIKKKEEKRRAQEKAQAEELAAQVNGKAITLSATAHDNGKLYGSITSQDIAEKLQIDKKYIQLEAPIKEAGSYEVTLHFYSEVEAKVALTVEPSKSAQKSK